MHFLNSDFARSIFSMYLFVLGIILISQAIIECIIPEKMYALQRKWIFHRWYPLHGLILSIGGLPLTLFRETLAGKIMMTAGIIVVYLGISSIKHRPAKATCDKKIRVVHEKNPLTDLEPSD